MSTVSVPWVSDLGSRRAVALAAAVIAAAVIVKTAWLGDDAAITLRTVLNFVHGYGPVYNVGERVQAYTHPLWFLILSALSVLLGNVFAAAFTASIVASVAAVWLVARYVAASAETAALAAAAMLLSKSYVDFSTSGLENPLSHLLLIFLFIAVRHSNESRRWIVAIFSTCAAIYLTRPDHVVLVAPVAMAVAWKARRAPLKLTLALAVSALPVLVWTGFSILYYGAPFPNTAYAKLGGGPDLGERLTQGMLYFIDSMTRDPITLTVISAGVAVGVLGSAVHRAVAAGILLHLAYVAAIGGDFMSGRFFSATFLLSIMLLASRRWDRASLVVAAGVVAVLGSVGLAGQLMQAEYSRARGDEQFGFSFIADERRFYAGPYGLLNALPGTWNPPDWSVRARATRVECGIGFVSIVSGPGLHLIDRCALADPLLARLPAAANWNWRIGHFVRDLPLGYFESQQTGQNLIVDPGVRAVYDVVRSATRDPLFDPGRLASVWRLTTGDLPPIDADAYRYSPVTVVAADVALPVAYGPWNGPGTVQFGRALDIHLTDSKAITELTISLDNNDRYRIEALVEGSFQFLGEVGPVLSNNGMIPYMIELAEPIPTSRLRIRPTGGDGNYSAGGLRVGSRP